LGWPSTSHPRALTEQVMEVQKDDLRKFLEVLHSGLVDIV
jgi:hypothetical protein